MAYPTLSQVKAYMGVSGAGDDVPLAQILAGVVKQVESFCGRVFVAAAATRTFPVKPPYVYNGLVLNLFADLVAVTTLTNGDGDVIPAAAYYLHEPNRVPYYQVRLLPESGYVFQSDGAGTAISLAGSWGYSTTCPEDVFLAIMEMCADAHGSRADGAGTQVSYQGTIIDKSKWGDNVLRVLEGRKR